MGNQQPGGSGGAGKQNRQPKRRPNISKLKMKRKNKNSQYNPSKLPDVTPNLKCRLRLCRSERIKDFLLIEQDFVMKQEEWKKEKEANTPEADREKEGEMNLEKQVESLRGAPLMVGKG
jgi:26S proteasome regulatory subunit T2